MIAPVQLHNLEVNIRLWLYSSQWMGCTHQHMLTLTPWTSQQVGVGSEMGQKCQTHMYVFVKMSRRLITLSSPPTPSFCSVVKPYSLFSHHASLSSHVFLHLSPNSRFPSFCCSSSLRSSVELLRQTETAALSFASELRETEEKEKRQKRERERGGSGGQTHPCLKTGFCREPRAGCQVCRSCTSGRFLTLWD